MANRGDVAFGCGMLAVGILVCLAFVIFDSTILLIAWLVGLPLVIGGLITIADGIWGRLGVPESRASPIARRQDIPPETKREVWARDRGACVLCGATTDLRFNFLTPESEGGNGASNLRVLCGSCEGDIARPDRVETATA